MGTATRPGVARNRGFFDNYNRPDGALAYPYISLQGSFGVSGGKVHCTSVTDGDAVVVDVGFSDQHVVAVMGAIPAAGNNAIGLLVRATDLTHCYLAQVVQGNAADVIISVYKNIGTGFVNLYTQTLVNNGPPQNLPTVVGDVLQFSAIGSTVSLTRNQIQLMSVTDTAIVSGTKAGIRAGGGASQGNGSFDEFRVL